MNQSDFCLLMFLFQITWYFKIFCLKVYKFLAKNGIYFDHEYLFTPVSFVVGKWVAVFESQNMAFGRDEYFVLMFLSASSHQIYVIN